MTGLHNIVYLVGIFVTLWNQSKGQFDPCFQRPKVPGPCRGSFPRFSYNLLTNRCERFIYGGCGGNQNNFETLRQCRNRCRFGGGGGRPLRCLLPRAPGPCRGSFRRFYYNVRTRRCEMFIYGGCLGNANRFETRNQCRRVCRVGWWG